MISHANLIAPVLRQSALPEAATADGDPTETCVHLHAASARNRVRVQGRSKPKVEHMRGIALRESVVASDLRVKLSKKGMRPSCAHHVPGHDRCDDANSSHHEKQLPGMCTCGLLELVVHLRESSTGGAGIGLDQST